jgi:protein PhnA
MKESELHQRSSGVCELCGDSVGLTMYQVPASGSRDCDILICSTCFGQLNGDAPLNGNHWRCLNSSIWSTVPAVQVVSWRMLHKLLAQGWAQDILDSAYLDDETLAWAREGIEDVAESSTQIIHRDSNGAVLSNGDTITLIKDLDVKGAGFTAKRGTAVKNIALVDNNASQIEGRVNGQQIVILTQYTKKA